MLRFVIILIALALYGAYSLVGSLAGSHTAKQAVAAASDATPPVSTGFGLGGAADMAMAAAAATSGLKFEALPAQGCSDSVLSPTKVEALVLSLPEPQKTALASILSASSNVWTAQLYKGPMGVGLCLPINGKLIVLPVGVNAAVDQVGAALPPLPAGLSLTKETP